MQNWNVQVLTYLAVPVPGRLMRSRWRPAALIKWRSAAQICSLLRGARTHGLHYEVRENQSGTIVFPLRLLKWKSSVRAAHTHSCTCTVETAALNARQGRESAVRAGSGWWAVWRPGDISSDPLRSAQILSDQLRSSLIFSDHLRSSQIVSDHLRLSQIVSDHLRSSQIISDHLRSSLIIYDHLWSSLIISDLLWSSQIFSDHLRSSQIISDHLRSSQIISDHLRSSQIISDHLRSSLIFSDHLRSSLIFSDHLRSSQIFSDHLRTSLIFSDHLRSSQRAPLTSSHDPQISSGNASHVLIRSNDSCKLKTGF